MESGGIRLLIFRRKDVKYEAGVHEIFCQYFYPYPEYAPELNTLHDLVPKMEVTERNNFSFLDNASA